MVWVSPSSKDQQFLLVNLHETDSVFVASNAVLATTEDVTVRGFGSNHQALIYGSVVGSAFGLFTIDLGDLPTADHGEFVHVMAGGQVEALNSGVGIATYGYDSEIINDGIVSSPGGVGILMRGSNATTHSTLLNNGLIEGDTAITRSGMDAVAETIVIRNTGTIRGETAAFGIFAQENGPGQDLITNSGRIYGKVELNSGDDLYDGRKGFIDDIVSGGTGNDRLFGGKERNVLEGDEGNDTIIGGGGGGGDQLSGGTEADQFVFKTLGDSGLKAASRDVIMDFSQAEADRINLKAIDADTTEKGNQHFDFIGKEVFSHEAGELRFVKNADGTFIHGDVNGDGKDEFVIALHPLLTLHATDFML